MNWKAVVAALAIAVVPTVSFAQDGGQPPQGQDRQRGGDRGNNPGGGRNFDPAEMQKRFMERFKEQLAVPDDEWKVIEPKLTKVMTAQRDVRGGWGMGGGRRGGDQNADQQSSSPVTTALRELRTAVEKPNSSAEEIDQKLAALREARAKAQANLDAARKELKELLTAKQEANLVLMGMLE